MMADLNQALTSQFQPRGDFSLEELLLLLSGRGDDGGMRAPPSISSVGFQAPAAPAETDPQDLSQTLASLFGGEADAETLDKLQKAGSLLGLFGPGGSAINFGAGQLARIAANEAFAGQPPIGFFEDIRRPDIFFGSPLDIQRGRETERVAANVAAAPSSPALTTQRSQVQDIIDRAVQRDSERAFGGSRPGRTGRSDIGSRERGLGARSGA